MKDKLLLISTCILRIWSHYIDFSVKTPDIFNICCNCLKDFFSRQPLRLRWRNKCSYVQQKSEQVRMKESTIDNPDELQTLLVNILQIPWGIYSRLLLLYWKDNLTFYKKKIFSNGRATKSFATYNAFFHFLCHNSRYIQIETKYIASAVAILFNVFSRVVKAFYEFCHFKTEFCPISEHYTPTS
jgi:hypothetical protein